MTSAVATPKAYSNADRSEPAGHSSPSSAKNPTTSKKHKPGSWAATRSSTNTPTQNETHGNNSYYPPSTCWEHQWSQNAQAWIGGQWRGHSGERDLDPTSGSGWWPRLDS